MRGHRLVADDVVRCDWRPPGIVFGQPAELLRHHIEIRGLGVLDIRELFGVTAVRERKRIDLVVRLCEWNDEEEFDRLGVEDRYHTILGHADPRAARAGAPRARHGQHHRDGGAQRAAAARRAAHRARVPRASIEGHLVDATRRAEAGAGCRRRRRRRGRSRAGPRRTWSTLAPERERHRELRVDPGGEAAEPREERGPSERASRTPSGPSPARPTVVVVSGLSGAGKSQALHALEDLGFFCVDNLPTLLAPQAVALCERGGMTRVALGIDVRVRAFLGEVGNVLAAPRGGRPARPPRALPRRERRDAAPPLQRDAPPAPALAHEDAAGGGAPRGRSRSSTAYASSASASRRSARARRASSTRRTPASTTCGASSSPTSAPRPGGAPRMVTRIVSFGFKYGTPVDADLVLDVRFLDNPYFVPELKALSGLDEPVADVRARRAGDAGVPAANARAPRVRDAAVRARGEELPDDRDRLHRGQASLGRHRRGARPASCRRRSGAPIGVLHRDVQRGRATLAAPPGAPCERGRLRRPDPRAASSRDGLGAALPRSAADRSGEPRPKASGDVMSEATGRFTIVNQLGLHARAATKLVQLASKFPCDVEIVARGPDRERQERDGRASPVRFEGDGDRGACARASAPRSASRRSASSSPIAFGEGR